MSYSGWNKSRSYIRLMLLITWHDIFLPRLAQGGTWLRKSWTARWTLRSSSRSNQLTCFPHLTLSGKCCMSVKSTVSSYWTLKIFISITFNYFTFQDYVPIKIHSQLKPSRLLPWIEYSGVFGRLLQPALYESFLRLWRNSWQICKLYDRSCELFRQSSIMSIFYVRLSKHDDMVI